MEGVFCISVTSDKFACPKYPFEGLKLGVKYAISGIFPQKLIPKCEEIYFYVISFIIFAQWMEYFVFM